MTKKPEPVSEADELETLKKRNEELEKKVLAGEEAALSRVCKALNVSPEEVGDKEASDRKRQEQIEKEPKIRCYVPFPVRVNTAIFQGFVEVPYSTFQVIQQAIGDRQMRLLREMTGKDYILQQVAGVGYVPQEVGQVNAQGEKVA